MPRCISDITGSVELHWPASQLLQYADMHLLFSSASSLLTSHLFFFRQPYSLRFLLAFCLPFLFLPLFRFLPLELQLCSSSALITQLPPQNDDHVGEQLFTSNSLHNETHASQTGVVQFFFSLRFVFLYILSILSAACFSFTFSDFQFPLLPFPFILPPPLRPGPHSDTQLLGSWSLWLAGRSQENLCALFATHCHIPFNLPTFPSSSWEITSLSAVYTSTPFCLHAALSTLICRLCKYTSLRPLWQGTVTAWCVILV